MKIHPSCCALVCAVLLMAGCASSQTARIQEKRQVFEDLPPKEQKQILAGKVKLGFTPDMVYLALGKPTRVTATKESMGPIEEWTYTHYVANPYRIVSGVVDQVPQFRPRDPFYVIRARPGPAGEQHEGALWFDPAEVYTLQIRFSSGKVVWLKLT